MSVHLHIETLVLDGLTRDDAAAVQAAIENALARLFGARLPAPPASRPAVIGAAVAQAVYQKAGRSQ